MVPREIPSKRETVRVGPRRHEGTEVLCALARVSSRTVRLAAKQEGLTGRSPT